MVGTLVGKTPVLRRTYSRQHTHISIAIVVAFLIAAATAYASRTFTAGPVVPNVVRTIQLDIQHPLGARYTGGAHHVSSQWHHSKGYSAAMLPYAGFMFMCITLARNSLQGRGPVTSKAIYQKSIVVQCVPSAVMPPVQMQIPSLEPQGHLHSLQMLICLMLEGQDLLTMQVCCWPLCQIFASCRHLTHLVHQQQFKAVRNNLLKDLC